MWQIMYGYFIVAKTRFSCKCYMNGRRMNINMLIIHIIHGPFGDIILNGDLQLDVGCNFTNAIKAILIVNVDCNCFLIANWSHKLEFFF